MDVSVIVPIYKGQKYIINLIDMVTNNAKFLKNKQLELIFVNDYPEEKIILPQINDKTIDIRLIINRTNVGIQRARINGIIAAKGEYLLLLDQDDFISEHYIHLQLASIFDCDAVVSNGFAEDISGNTKRLWSSVKTMNNVNKLDYYFYFGNVIASPGLCLIKKSAIPNEWINNTISINGADDWLLWVLFLLNDGRFAINYKTLYTHRSNNNNTSNNEENMINSSVEACELLEKLFSNNSKIKKLGSIYRRRLNMRKSISNGGLLNKIIQYVKNIDIALYVMKNR